MIILRKPKQSAALIHYHDDRYYVESEIDSLLATVSGSIVEDHGLLHGLLDDDHPQYHTDSRGDVRYYLKSQVDTISGTLQSNVDGKSDLGHTHDDRYYTESEVDFLVATASGITDHSALNNLSYVSSGHTGFASSDQLTSVSGTLQEQIDGLDIDFDYVMYVDGGTSFPVLTQSGSLTAPYGTIQQALDEIGYAASAEEFQEHFLINILTPGTYAENLSVPHRSITIIGRNVIIDGNINRYISTEKQYFVPYVTWMGLLYLCGDYINYDSTVDDFCREGIKLTGNYTIDVVPGDSGAQHELFFKGCCIEGDVAVLNDAGSAVFHAEDCRFTGTVSGTSVLLEYGKNIDFDCSFIEFGSIFELHDVKFYNKDPWLGYQDVDMRIYGFDSDSNHFRDCYFKQVNLTTYLSETVRMDAYSHSSWSDEVNYETIVQTESFLEKSSGIGNDSSVTGDTVKDALEYLESNWNFGSNTVSGTGDVYCNNIYTFGTISGTGDIYCNDIHTSGDSVYIGSSNLTSSGTGMSVSNHGPGMSDELVNVCYGTGDPPDAGTVTEGALWIKYTT
jgi:hypothetical protein